MLDCSQLLLDRNHIYYHQLRFQQVLIEGYFREMITKVIIKVYSGSRASKLPVPLELRRCIHQFYSTYLSEKAGFQLSELCTLAAGTKKMESLKASLVKNPPPR